MTINEISHELSKRYKDVTFYILNKDKTYISPSLRTNVSIIDDLGNEYAYSTELEGFVIRDEPINGAYRRPVEYEKSIILKKFMTKNLLKENL
ncbi:hypothetical protein LBP97_23310 [Serratia marcescens]|nr:hypothetical protein LBP97_23310 [Serratia marcescens]